MRKASRPSGKSVLPKARNALRWLIGQALAICWEIPPMSAIGTKRTSPSALHMSAFEGKADIRYPVQRLVPLLGLMHFFFQIQIIKRDSI